MPAPKNPVPRKPSPVGPRFWAKVQKGEGDECWEWTGAKTPQGYGKICDRAVAHHPRPAHRVSWELAYGVPPAGLYICHHCDNPGCVRPDHLFLGDAKTNMIDKAAKGRHHMQQKTHCINGHEFTPENTYRNPKFPQRRNCRECVNGAQSRARREKT